MKQLACMQALIALGCANSSGMADPSGGEFSWKLQGKKCAGRVDCMLQTSLQAGDDGGLPGGLQP